MWQHAVLKANTNRTQTQYTPFLPKYELLAITISRVPDQNGVSQARYIVAWVGVKNFGFTEEQKNIEQGSIKLKELHVCIMRVQKKMAAWRSEVPENAGKRYLRMSQSESRRVAHCMYVEIEFKNFFF